MPSTPARAPQPAPAFQPPRSIAIEGPIRVGKSTLARVLADRLRARRVLDPEDNPFLADFYKEKAGAAFRTQMYFLIERHRRLSEVQQSDTAPLVSDFLFEKDKIFAYVNLDNEELKLYERYYETFVAGLKAPDLVIYLQATPEVLLERIAKKKAPGEKQISRAYL
jgi:deoxyadenosine/deoxycytidine kinase